VRSLLPWLAVAAITMAAGLFTVGLERQRLPQAHHAPARSATAAGVEVSAALSLRADKAGASVVVLITITNSADEPQPFIGAACFDPATVVVRSTRPYPAGPAYGPSAAVVRTRLLDSARSRDEIAPFVDEGAGAQAAGGCDKMGVPALPAHSIEHYQQSATIALPGENFVDAATTEVVTSVQLARFPPGADLTVLEPAGQVEVRTPLSAVASGSAPSRADYASTAAAFDTAMRDPGVAGWVQAQDPELWKGARVEKDGHGGWTLTAFHSAWAVPLSVDGAGSTVVTAKIPSERRVARPSVQATLPPDAAASPSTYVLGEDYYAGDLVLPSGKVMVGDPVSSDSMLTFDYHLKPGSYPIHLVTAHVRYLGHDWDRNAWEALSLSAQPVSRWEPAIPVGHSRAELKPGEVFEWGTDGGEGGFASPEAMKVEDQSLGADEALYTDLGGREEANDWAFGIATADARTGANIFGCTSGFGDGGYPVFLGVDAQGRPAALLSDFGVLGVSYGGF
jgi:hypothetical protein